jgi:hypothetical protein
MRFMLIHRSASFNGEVRPSPECIDACLAIFDREVKAGRAIVDGGLSPPSAGVGQLRLANGKVETLDGPFAETKEVIGGFAIFELPDLAAAKAKAKELFDIHLRYFPEWEGICEIRPMAGSIVETIKAEAAPQKARA